MKKRSKIIIIALLCLILFTYLINYFSNRMFYNINASYNEFKTISCIYTQIVFPNITVLSFDKPQCTVFSKVSTDFYASEYFLTEAKWEGKVGSFLGQIESNKSIVCDYVLPQSYYRYETKNVSEFLEAKPKQRFKVVIGCKEIKYTDFINYYSKLYGYDEFIDINLNWIAIKTSDNPDDFAIGVPGPLNAVVAETIKGTDIMRYSFQNDNKQKEYLENCLWFLNEKQNEVQRIEKSKFFDNIEIDFESRLDYLEKNEFEVIGFLVYMKKEEIDKFINNINYYIINIEPV